MDRFRNILGKVPVKIVLSEIHFEDLLLERLSKDDISYVLGQVPVLSVRSEICF